MMDRDKALRKALKPVDVQLPYGFESRVMKQVFAAAEKKRARAYALGLALTSLLSIALAVGGYFVIALYFPFDFKMHLPTLQLTPGAAATLRFCIYIALMVLGLLALDMYVRRRVRKFRQG